MQPSFAIGERDELDLGAGQLAIGWHERQPFDFRRDDSERGVWGLGGEGVIDRAGGLPFEPEAAREVGLGIEVDEEDALFRHGECGSQVDGGGGFANATLLIGDGDNPG